GGGKVRGEAEAIGESAGEDPRRARARSPLVVRLAPDGGYVAPTEDVERPTREALSRIVLSAAAKEQAARRESALERLGETQPLRPLRRAEGEGVPLGRFGVRAGVEGGLAAHRQGEAGGGERLLDGVAAREERLPGFLGVGRSRARLVPEASDAHLEGDGI